MIRIVRATVITLVAAGAVFAGATAAHAGDPSQWGAIAGDPSQWDASGNGAGKVTYND